MPRPFELVDLKIEGIARAPAEILLQILLGSSVGVCCGKPPDSNHPVIAFSGAEGLEMRRCCGWASKFL